MQTWRHFADDSFVLYDTTNLNNLPAALVTLYVFISLKKNYYKQKGLAHKFSQVRT